MYTITIRMHTWKFRWGGLFKISVTPRRVQELLNQLDAKNDKGDLVKFVVISLD